MAASKDERVVTFRKLQGCGNNFVVLTHADSGLEWNRCAVRLLDRNFGLGTDGLMVIGARLENGCYPVAMYNPDGSECGMCGNGIRCVMRFLYLEAIVPAELTDVTFSVYGRRISCHSTDQGRNVRVDMGPPNFAPSAVPIASETEFIDQPLPQMAELRGTCLSMGNPHCVIFVEDLSRIAFEELGPRLERHPLFPARANVEFCQRLSKDHVKVAVWERGAGPTLACGTGACAVVVAGHRLGMLSPTCRVELPGGSVEIEYHPGGAVHMTGPAVEIFRGVLDAPFINFLMR